MTIEVRFHTAGSNADNIIVTVETGLGASTVNTLAITRPGAVALTISPKK